MNVWIDKFQMIAWETETKLDRVKYFLVSGVYIKTRHYLFDGVCSENFFGLWMVLE